jgi:oligoribonuclease NrnB/cAMP/cGMP phosphodiesterase (DHH superfamily)
MGKATVRRAIQIISHGPSCLDGVVAAAAVARFYDGHRVAARLVANNDSDRVLQGLELRAGGEEDEIWVTDLSWNLPATGQHLTELAQKGASIYWVDHHRTAVGRADAPEFKIPFAGRVLSEQFSAARLTFNYLRRRVGTLPAARARAFEEFAPFAAIADDHDRWLHRIPESKDWALAVQTLGGADSYREILRMHELRMTRKLRTALEAGREAMAHSLELARSTIVDRPLDNGMKVRSACCFGYSSEVAAALYEDQSRAVIALFDLRSQGVSLRRSTDCKVDLSALARTFGGGGHPAAAGFATSELKRAPAERLAEILGDRLESVPS